MFRNSKLSLVLHLSPYWRSHRFELNIEPYSFDQNDRPYVNWYNHSKNKKIITVAYKTINRTLISSVLARDMFGKSVQIWFVRIHPVSKDLSIENKLFPCGGATRYWIRDGLKWMRIVHLSGSRKTILLFVFALILGVLRPWKNRRYVLDKRDILQSDILIRTMHFSHPKNDLHEVQFFEIKCIEKNHLRQG